MMTEVVGYIRSAGEEHAVQGYRHLSMPYAFNMGPNLLIKDRNKKLLQQLLEKAELKTSRTSAGVAPLSRPDSHFKFLSPTPIFKLLPPIELTSYRLKKLVEEIYGPPIDRTNWSKPFRFSSENETTSPTDVTQSSGAPSPRTVSSSDNAPVMLPRGAVPPEHSTGGTLETKEQEHEQQQRSMRETRNRQSSSPQVAESTLTFKIITGLLIFVILVIVICIISISDYLEFLVLHKVIGRWSCNNKHHTRRGGAFPTLSQENVGNFNKD
ncbi:hypothetical protein E2C01_083477 [Portunus trituberculatus]|uniref:Uncharacterized protein n=1 Tax=Portunus trituberculatus TaxID=210409 RepID=A0A5B7J4T0_PORTR|nr:hypothetical protein [Portunus trituberculatus]